MADTSEIWTGEAALYDQMRPSPPPVLLDIFTQLVHKARPDLVVDLGSGTGLSTRLWGERAHRVIGIEPNVDMRAVAIQATKKESHAAQIEYREGISSQTGLPAGCADIVTCSQSFHWMEPDTTLAEVARILRPGGLFAAYDYDWPPTISWELEQIYHEVDDRFGELDQERGFTQSFQRWPKESHLDRMRNSGHFRFTREQLVHHIEEGDAARFIGLVFTNVCGRYIKQGAVTEEEIGLDRLKHAALTYIGSGMLPWYVSYHVRIGIV